MSAKNTKTAYDDSMFINPQTLQLYAKTNEEYLAGPVKGIVVEFPGLDGGSCLGGSLEMASYCSCFAQDFAKSGVILAYVFTGPWSWTHGSTRFADAVVAAVARKYDLPDGFPLVSCGGSMGGHGSLMFAMGTSHTLRAAAAACPCIDPVVRVNAHPELARTFISAAAKYDMPLADALKAFSPVERINDLPDIPYFICSDGDDEVLPAEGCDAYVENMRACGLSVEYIKQPGLKHGDFFPSVRQALHDFIKKQILD